MSRPYKFRCRALAAMLAPMLLWSSLSTSALASPVPWSNAAYSHMGNNSPVSTVLREFASGFSLTLVLDPEVKGVVNGMLTATDATEFLSKLGALYGFTWYTHAGTLYIHKTDKFTSRVVRAPGAGGVARLKRALADIGVIEPRFGWGELDADSVLLSGPPTYVSLVEGFIQNLTPAAGGAGPQMAVIRLKYMAAEDRTITYRDKKIIQPGMVSMLRGLVSGVPVSPSTTTEAPVSLAAAAQMGDAKTTPAEPQSPPAGKAAAPQMPTPAPGRSAGSIQSNPRLNAIVVQDTPERIAAIEELIAKLDVPAAQIEIEAMIVDINTDRARDLGIAWQARGGGIGLSFGTLANAATAGTISLASRNAPSNSSATLLPDQGAYLLAQITALEARGDARVVSRPSVLTSDNIGALLDLSETFYVRQQGERVTNLTAVSTGITLRVTPRLISNGAEQAVHLTIDIEDGQAGSSTVDSLPVVSRGVVSTEAVVKPNETLLIAGHTSERNSDKTQKVPLLGDLPVVGGAFSTRSQASQKLERLFMIRHRVLGLPLMPAAAYAVGDAKPLTLSRELQMLPR